jgi:hypothetical protein
MRNELKVEFGNFCPLLGFSTIKTTSGITNQNSEKRSSKNARGAPWFPRLPSIGLTGAILNPPAVILARYSPGTMMLAPSKVQRAVEVANDPVLLLWQKTKTSIVRKNKRIPNTLGNFVNIATNKMIDTRKNRLKRSTLAARTRSPTVTATELMESEPPVDGADQSVRFTATTVQAGTSKDIENLVF